MKYLKRLFLFAVLLILAFLFGCGNFNYSAYYFNTDVYIWSNPNDKTAVIRSVTEILDSLDGTFSTTEKTSLLYKFNLLSKGQSIAVSEDFSSLLSVAKNYYSFTEKLFNPAVYPLLKLWKLSSDTYDKNKKYVDIPDASDIENGISLANAFSSLTIKDNIIVKPEDGFMIDLGGIAKGYAVDKIKTVLEENGATEGYVSIGGSSIYIFSTKEDLSVTHPRKIPEKPFILSIKNTVVKNKSLSTSGDYMRYYIDKNGKHYSHVINPLSGYPTDSGFSSVTVIGKTATECDILSTFLMTLDKTAFISFIKNNLTDCSVFGAYEKDGEKLLLTNEKQDNFTLLDNAYSVYSV